MNKVGREIIITLTSNNNVSHLARRVGAAFDNDPLVMRWMGDQFGSYVWHFAKAKEQELGFSDLLPGVSVREEVDMLNDELLRCASGYIHNHILPRPSHENDIFSVSDGAPTTRRPASYRDSSADEMLDKWRANSGRGIHMREDVMGDAPEHGGYGSSNPRGAQYHNNNVISWMDRAKAGLPVGFAMQPQPWNQSGYGNVSHPARVEPMQSGYNPRMGSRGGEGITFYDPSGSGQQQHLDMFENNTLMQNLNQGHAGTHYATAFGVSTPESDARLLGRNIFRKNEDGVESGISRYERRLCRRRVDTDVSEGLAGRERDNHIRGHDMSSLHSHVDNKNKYKYQEWMNSRTRSNPDDGARR